MDSTSPERVHLAALRNASTAPTLTESESQPQQLRSGSMNPDVVRMSRSLHAMNKPPPLAMMDTSFMKIMMAKMEKPKTLDIYTHHEPSNDGSVVDKKKNDQSLERSLDAPPPAKRCLRQTSGNSSSSAVP